MVTRSLDSLVAQGNTSDVYRWGNDAVVKVLRTGIPEEWADREAHTAQLVHKAGLPVPEVLDVTRVNGRPGIVFERIAGVSMWEQMLANRGDIPLLVRCLVSLQADVNATVAPPGIPKLIDRLRENIECASLLSTSEREEASAELERHPDSSALCHFDVHPNNVLMGPDGPFIIDWFDAAAGSPAADIVRSSVLMRIDAASGYLHCADATIISYVHDLYVSEVARTRDVESALLLQWERPVIASRLAEPIDDAIRRSAHETWLTLHSSRPTRLAMSLWSVGRAPPGLIASQDEL